jgi:hypothetical protein
MLKSPAAWKGILTATLAASGEHLFGFVALRAGKGSFDCGGASLREAQSSLRMTDSRDFANDQRLTTELGGAPEQTDHAAH